MLRFPYELKISNVRNYFYNCCGDELLSILTWSTTLLPIIENLSPRSYEQNYEKNCVYRLIVRKYFISLNLKASRHDFGKRQKKK